jgi:hypothetical protein
MKTLEMIKKEKNFKAHIKGYCIDPEGFPKWWLLERLDMEYKELLGILDDRYIEEYPENIIDELVMDELADMSNIIDYLSSKIVVNYPDRYDPEEVEG